MVVVPASAQNKKKKRSKKKLHAESGHVQARYVCELSCRHCHRHSSYLQQKHSLVFLYLFFFVKFFIHSSIRTAVDFGGLRNFRLPRCIYIYELLFAPHLSYIWNEYAHTRMPQKKRFIMIARVQKKKEIDVCVCVCTHIV